MVVFHIVMLVYQRVYSSPVYVKSAWIRKKNRQPPADGGFSSHTDFLVANEALIKISWLIIKVSSKVIYSKMRCASKWAESSREIHKSSHHVDLTATRIIPRRHRSFHPRQDTKCEKIPRGVSAGIRTWSVPTGTSWPIWERFLGSAV